MQNIPPILRGRRIALGTRHQKEQVIAPLLQAELGLLVVVPPDFDSDRFGTFTRERERLGTQLEAARFKAKAVMAETGLDMGIASEGSFGPHPDVPFVPLNIELVVLIDEANGMELVGRSVSTAVRHVHGYVTSRDEAYALAKRAGFPTHGLVVRMDEASTDGMVKGIVTPDAFNAALDSVRALRGAWPLCIESDLRAHMHPTRMEQIRLATQDLVTTARRTCPACQAPGFALMEVRPGLPCAWCRLPTALPLANVFSCWRCEHRSEMRYPNDVREADPGNCPFCNP